MQNETNITASYTRKTQPTPNLTPMAYITRVTPSSFFSLLSSVLEADNIQCYSGNVEAVGDRMISELRLAFRATDKETPVHAWQAENNVHVSNIMDEFVAHNPLVTKSQLKVKYVKLSCQSSEVESLNKPEVAWLIHQNGECERFMLTIAYEAIGGFNFNQTVVIDNDFAYMLGDAKMAFIANMLNMSYTDENLYDKVVDLINDWNNGIDMPLDVIKKAARYEPLFASGYYTSEEETNLINFPHLIMFLLRNQE